MWLKMFVSPSQSGEMCAMKEGGWCEFVDKITPIINLMRGAN